MSSVCSSMPVRRPDMSREEEIFSIAHTASCKLHLAAERPDRDLRFVLGHAFTLDKLRLRIAEIETEKQNDEDVERVDGGRRRVNFQSARPSSRTARKKSPPPSQIKNDSDTDTSEEEIDEEAEDDGLSLQRFESASARPPQMVDDDSSSSEEDEPVSPPPMPSDDILKMVTEEEGDATLTAAYQRVSGCPCHGQHNNSPVASKVWEIPREPGGPRLAVVEVEA